mgnify:FL=1
MNAREINELIKSSAKCGLNVYAKTIETVIMQNGIRITEAKSIRGVVKVKALNSGSWFELLENKVYAQ